MGCGELVAADEPAIGAKPVYDATVVEDGQGDRCLADPTGANESDWHEVLYETNDLLDQFAPSEEDPWWRRW